MTRGALPILLERKAQILDRIRALRPEEQLSSLRADVADKVVDPEARDELLNLTNERFKAAPLCGAGFGAPRAGLCVGTPARHARAVPAIAVPPIWAGQSAAR